ncbi:MAG: hypothetical protein IJI14_17655 [Anaerolineaceae bacterium]|nr:hypothetical protein [Anaerolineaceae bacterium]
MIYYILGVRITANKVFCYQPQYASKNILKSFILDWSDRPEKDSFGLSIIRSIVEAGSSEEAKKLFVEDMLKKDTKVFFINLSKLWICRQWYEAGKWKSACPTPVRSHEQLMSFISEYPEFRNFDFVWRSVDTKTERTVLIQTDTYEKAEVIAEQSLEDFILEKQEEKASQLEEIQECIDRARSLIQTLSDMVAVLEKDKTDILSLKN